MNEAEVQAAMREWARTDMAGIVFGWLAAKYGYETRTTLVPNDPGTSAFQEGQRSVVVGISNFIYGPDVRQPEAEVKDQVETGDYLRPEGTDNDGRSGDPIF